MKLRVHSCFAVAARGIAFACLFLTAASAAQSEGGGKRLALVIGNSQYQSVYSLRNAVNDSEAVAEKLEALGFEVVSLENARRKEFRRAIDEFTRKAKGAEATLFYFSGHGFQLKGINYLVPTDAALKSVESIEKETLRLDTIIGQLQSKNRQTLIFLDACRNDPLPENLRDKVSGPGLAQIETGRGTFVAFATQPGNVTLDGTEDHSPFTAALLDHLDTPGISISDMMIRVRTEVEETTDQTQTPWDQSSLRSQFYFNPEGEGDAALTDEDRELLMSLDPELRKKFEQRFGLTIESAEDASDDEAEEPLYAKIQPQVSIEAGSDDDAEPEPLPEEPQPQAIVPNLLIASGDEEEPQEDAPTTATLAPDGPEAAQADEEFDTALLVPSPAPEPIAPAELEMPQALETAPAGLPEAGGSLQAPGEAENATVEAALSVPEIDPLAPEEPAETTVDSAGKAPAAAAAEPAPAAAEPEAPAASIDDVPGAPEETAADAESAPATPGVEAPPLAAAETLPEDVPLVPGPSEPATAVSPEPAPEQPPQKTAEPPALADAVALDVPPIEGGTAQTDSEPSVAAAAPTTPAAAASNDGVSAPLDFAIPAPSMPVTGPTFEPSPVPAEAAPRPVEPAEPSPPVEIVEAPEDIAPAIVPGAAIESSGPESDQDGRRGDLVAKAPPSAANHEALPAGTDAEAGKVATVAPVAEPPALAEDTAMVEPEATPAAPAEQTVMAPAVGDAAAANETVAVELERPAAGSALPQEPSAPAIDDPAPAMTSPAAVAQVSPPAVIPDAPGAAQSDVAVLAPAEPAGTPGAALPSIAAVEAKTEGVSPAPDGAAPQVVAEVTPQPAAAQPEETLKAETTIPTVTTEPLEEVTVAGPSEALADVRASLPSLTPSASAPDQEALAVEPSRDAVIAAAPTPAEVAPEVPPPLPAPSLDSQVPAAPVDVAALPAPDNVPASEEAPAMAAAERALARPLDPSLPTLTRAPEVEAAIAPPPPALVPAAVPLEPELQMAAIDPDELRPDELAVPSRPEAVIREEDLPRLIQEQLARLGCYRSTVDGDWGSGSAKALLRYYATKKIAPDNLHPDAALLARLIEEETVVCTRTESDKPKPKVKTAKPSKPRPAVADRPSKNRPAVADRPAKAPKGVKTVKSQPTKASPKPAKGPKVAVGVKPKPPKPVGKGLSVGAFR